MNRILLSVIFVITFQNTYSQEKDLLRQYKFRIKQYKALVFSPIAGLNSSNVKQSLGNNKNKSYAIYGVGELTLLKSTDKVLQNMTIGLGSNYNGYRGKNYDGNGSGQKDVYINTLFNFNTRLYKHGQYIELGIEARGNFGKSTFDQTNSGQVTTGEKKLNTYTLQPVVGAGIGRLENITDMQNAIWLTKLLQKNNRLKRKPNKDEMNDLARTITTSSNYRILDARRRIQHILKEVDKSLTKNELVSNVDINYFTALNDAIFFANNYARFNGKDIFIRVTPYIRSFHADFGQTSTVQSNELEKTKNSSGQLQLGYKRYRPIDLKNQLNFGIIAKGTIGKEHYKYQNKQGSTIVTDVHTNTNWKEAAIEHFVQYSFYPNTRTVLTVEVKGENGKYFNDIVKEVFHTNALTAGGSYFINFNTRLNLGLTLNSQNTTNRFVQATSYKQRGTNLSCNFGVDFTF